jgi:lipoprotein-releasing system permease protein
VIGTVLGLSLGFIVCWLQQELGFVKLQGDTLIMDAYPVTMKTLDFILVFITVLVIGYIAAWYPARYMSKKFLKNEKKK